MKVIHSCTSESFSGLEAYVLDLAYWQYAQGRDVELFCREGTELERGARDKGVPVWTIPSRARPGVSLWRAIHRGWRQRLRAAPAVLHMHAGGEPRYHLPVLGFRPRRLLKAVLHYHIWINHKKTDPAHRLLYAALDEVWTSSESARAHLATLLPVRRDRIRVVPYGRDVQALLAHPREQWRAEMRSRLSVAENEILGVCVSRIEPIKGVRELFAAFVETARKRPGAHLAIVGGASPQNESAAELERELHQCHERLADGLKRRLHLVGFAPCEPYLAAADFYVLPSYEECMSLAMLDAAIFGLPILGTSSGGTPSVARPGETGWLVPPKDAQALARVLDEAFADADNCRRLGRNAGELGRAFDREVIFRRIWDWYAALVPTTIKQ